MAPARMVQARIGACVYGAGDPKKGADGSVYDCAPQPEHHRIDVTSGIADGEAGALLQDFFRARR